MNTAKVLVGDNRKRLAELPDGSVQCVVTSPPYWGLRDYGKDDQIGMESTPDEFVEQQALSYKHYTKPSKNKDRWRVKTSQTKCMKKKTTPTHEPCNTSSKRFVATAP